MAPARRSPNPIYSKWFDEYGKKNPNVRINYQPIGSGGGIRQITRRRCSSAPPTAR
jgi:ABC-type phosphate transport system substrate-binding protein